MLSSLDHHELLVFWAELLVIYATARLLGAGARRLGLPSVVGELGAGVVLGPSLFGSVWEGGFDWFLPGSEVQSALLLAVSWFSAAFLLVVAGFETDLALIKRLGRAAVLVTLGSLLVPLVGGLIVGSQIPDTFYGDEATRLVFTLFIGVSVAVSALAVVAKILGDLKLMRRDVGQITVAVGMANDLVGWVILGVIAGLAAGDVSLAGVLITIAGLAAFLMAALTIGQRAVDSSLRYVRREGPNLQGALTVTVGAMLGFGVITQWLGVEAVLGAFVAGVVLSRSRYRQVESQHIIEDLTSVIFAPLFFATAGLRLDLGLLRGEALVWAVLLLAVALALKFVGSFVGARAAGLTAREGMVLGAGLNARGALEIIIATVGLSLGVLNDTSFTMIVMIPLVTSLFASIGVRVLSRDLEGSTIERERLAAEEAMAKNLVVRNGRLLLPSNGEPSSIVAAQIAHLVWPETIPATVLGIQEGEDPPDLEPVQNVLFGREVDVLNASSVAIAERMIAESKLGYGAMAVGVDDAGIDGSFVSELVDELLAELHIPIVLVRGARNQDGRLPGIFARALVPVVGSQSSRAAEELAGNMSNRLGTEVLLSHIVYSPDASGQGGILYRSRATNSGGNGADVADRVLEQAARHAQELRANYKTEVRFSVSAGDEILRQAVQSNSDLIVLGSELRRLEGRPFLGQNVEYVLRNATQTVVVAIIPNARPS
jgi:Kef-type K+ transport system membrane component KefB/nucleotide-binding universal stress UspA family protein